MMIFLVPKYAVMMRCNISRRVGAVGFGFRSEQAAFAHPSSMVNLLLRRNVHEPNLHQILEARGLIAGRVSAGGDLVEGGGEGLVQAGTF